MTEKKEKKRKRYNVLSDRRVYFQNPIKDVYTGKLPIAGAACINTHDGLVLIDTLLTPKAAKRFKKKIERKVEGRIKYIIYTHGHGDHVGGASAFLEDNPEIISNKYLPDRFDKYKMLAPHRAHISAVQFNIPEVVRERKYVYPTKTIIGDYSFKLGDKTFNLHTARGETDDVCWVHIPEINAAFVGDMVISSFPNIGNPWKPTRFALDWAKTLEKIRSLNLEYLFYGGAGRIHTGEDVEKALTDNIDVIRSLHDQVIDYINEGVHITEMIHKVKIPKHLKDSPYLKTGYSRPEFFVFNVYRWYHGYFDDNPAHLLPRPEKEVKNEIVDIIGEKIKLIDRAEQLLKNQQPQLAIQVLDFLLQTDPKNIDARKLHIKILRELKKSDHCLMSKNAWSYYIKKDKEILENIKNKDN